MSSTMHLEARARNRLRRYRPHRSARWHATPIGTAYRSDRKPTVSLLDPSHTVKERRRDAMRIRTLGVAVPLVLAAGLVEAQVGCSSPSSDDTGDFELPGPSRGSAVVLSADD